MNSEKLGLFVVSSLAARHQINVSLRRSAYGGTTAIVLLPFGVIVRAEEDEPPAIGHSGGWQGLRPDLGDPGPEPRSPEPRSPGSRDWSPFGVTGRHRLPAAATGRRVDTGEIPRLADPEWPPAPRTAPRSPWEYQPPAPQPSSAAPPSPERPELPMPPWDAVATYTVDAAGPAGRVRANRAAPGGFGWPERQAALAGPPRPRIPRRPGALTSGCPSASPRPAWHRSCGPVAIPARRRG